MWVSSDRNIINELYIDGASSSKYGIWLDSGAEDNIVVDCIIVDCVWYAIYNLGTGNWIKHNLGTGNILKELGTDTKLATIKGGFPLSNVGGGATAVTPVINTSPGGVDIDADNEFAHIRIILPAEVQHVVRIKIWAYSNVIEATNNMLLRIVAHGAGSSELWDGTPIDVVEHPSVEEGGIVQYDVVHWAIVYSDDAQVEALIGQDLVELLAVGEAAADSDITTDALFGGWEIEYV